MDGSVLGFPRVGVALDSLLWVEGTGAVGFVDTQITQDVAGMRPGEVRRSLLLEPRGKLRAVLWVLRAPEAVGLITPVETTEQVVADLNRFRFRVAAAVRVDDRPVHSVWDADAVSGWSDDGDTLVAGISTSRRVVASHQLPAGDVLDRDGVASRFVSEGEPRFGIEVDESTIPQETGLVPESVSFTKGCYLGQELVARIDSRGHVNRVLRRLRGVGATPPTGAAVTREGAALGVLGTVAPFDGDWGGLVLLRREAAPGDAVVVEWDGGTAAGIVEEIASQSPNGPMR